MVICNGKFNCYWTHGEIEQLEAFLKYGMFGTLLFLVF